MVVDRRCIGSSGFERIRSLVDVLGAIVEFKGELAEPTNPSKLKVISAACAMPLIDRHKAKHDTPTVNQRETRLFFVRMTPPLPCLLITLSSCTAQFQVKWLTAFTLVQNLL